MGSLIMSDTTAATKGIIAALNQDLDP